jgi:hypothetical protein
MHLMSIEDRRLLSWQRRQVWRNRCMLILNNRRDELP